MRVAVVADLIRPNGAGIMALEGARMLNEAGHEVMLVGGSLPSHTCRSLSSRGVAASGFHYNDAPFDRPLGVSEHREFRAEATRWLINELEHLDPDVAWIHNIGRVLSQRELADLSRRLPVAHTMHDEWFFTDAHYTYDRNGVQLVRTAEPYREPRLVDRDYGDLFAVPEAMGRFLAIAPSEWLEHRARAVFPTMPIRCVTNAVDPNLFSLHRQPETRRNLGLPVDKSIVLFVGSPDDPRKGFDRLVQILAQVSYPSEEPILLVVGGSETGATRGALNHLEKGSIKRFLSDAGGHEFVCDGLDRINLSGLSREDIAAVYGAADLVVHPSLIDNLPTVPIEATLTGTRVLASNVGGTKECVPHANDLFELDESDSVLAGRVTEALFESRKAPNEGRARRRNSLAEKVSPERFVRSLEQGFEWLQL